MSKGFQDITEALQEECSHLFYTEETGIRDRVFEVRMVGVVWWVLYGGYCVVGGGGGGREGEVRLETFFPCM